MLEAHIIYRLGGQYRPDIIHAMGRLLAIIEPRYFTKEAILITDTIGEVREGFNGIQILISFNPETVPKGTHVVNPDEMDKYFLQILFNQG